MSSATLSPLCSDEEVVDFALQHYFLPEELAEARRMREAGSTYEEAVAYLADRGQATLRNSGETQPPHMFLTIPPGMVFVYHPERRFPHRPVLRCHVGYLASRALPQPSTEIQAATMPAQAEGHPYQCFSLFDDVPTTDGGEVEKTKGPRTRPKKLKYVEQLVRMGTRKTWWTQPGWVVKDGYLGYVMKGLQPGFYEVSLVHLKSNHVMATVYLSALDEATQARVQAWVTDALRLTDWSRGITAILKEKTGEQKKAAWSRQLEELWKQQRPRCYQFSLFDTGEQS